MPSLSIFGRDAEPGHVALDHEGRDRLLAGVLGVVRMYTISTSASGPFVIHIFEPFASQPPSTRSARHDIDPITSEPASASLIASAPHARP